jgi:hypothetical protein
VFDDDEVALILVFNAELLKDTVGRFANDLERTEGSEIKP